MRLSLLLSPSSLPLPNARGLDRLRVSWKARMFTARVLATLEELGLEPGSLRQAAQRLVRDTSALCYLREPETARPEALALEFFLRYTLEYPNLIDPERQPHSLLTHGIVTIRAWQLVDRIPDDLAEASIERIKRVLVAQLRNMDDTAEELVEAELRILQL